MEAGAHTYLVFSKAFDFHSDSLTGGDTLHDLSYETREEHKNERLTRAARCFEVLVLPTHDFPECVEELLAPV